MKRLKILLLTVSLVIVRLPADAAEPVDIAACAIVTMADAEKFIGAPLEIVKIDKKITINAPWSHESLCTYLPQGVKSDKPSDIARFLDVSLRFSPTPDAAQAIHQATLDQFRKMTESPDAPFKITAMKPVEGLAAQAFYVEFQADAKSDYPFAMIMFVKATISGAVSAWKKPEPSLELSKAVLQQVLMKLP